MDSKMSKTQEKSKQLQEGKLEMITKKGLNHLIKNLSLRNKFTRSVSVAVSVVGFSISMTMPAKADIDRTNCEGDHDTDDIVIVQGHDESKAEGGDGIKGNGERKCFEGDGEQDVNIHNVESLYSRENTGSVETNVGTFQFWENEHVNFNIEHGSTVTITGISLD